MSLTPDFRVLFENGFAAIDAAEESNWHDTTFDESGIPYVHCSSIAGCPREYVLKAAGEATDGNTVDSGINFAFGHSLHSSLEQTFKLIPEFDGWTWIGVEQGGVHSKMPLTGKPDACLRSPALQPVMFDLKSEAGQGKQMREKEAVATKAVDAARHEHKLQITGGAMIYEDLGIVDEAITTGMVLYVSRQIGKNVWDFSTVLFEITSALRAEVAREVTHKANAWLKYKEAGELPPRLPMEMSWGRMQTPWKCAPRDKENDMRGKYCSARFNCMEKFK